MTKISSMPVMYESNIPDFPLFSRGKVRDIYDITGIMGFPALLPVTTDRISAFDVVLDQVIPMKGIVLNQLSLFWFDFLNVPNHLITANIGVYPKELQKYREQLEGRSMIVRKHRIVPLECIVRGYLTGFGKIDYDKIGKVCWHKLPEGLIEASELPNPIFTPSTKAEQGMHDENISSRDDAVRILEKYFVEDSHSGYQPPTDDSERFEWAAYRFSMLECFVLSLYRRARGLARKRGIIIADTKFEVDYIDTHNHIIILCDESLTPDSSRFWRADKYEPGRSQESFDKQFIRDYLASQRFTGQGEPPELPSYIVEQTSQKYLQAFEMLTGKPLQT